MSEARRRWREDLGEKERRVLTCALFLTAAAAFGDDDGAEDHPRGAVDGIIANIERYRMSIEPSSAISRRRLGSEVLRSPDGGFETSRNICLKRGGGAHLLCVKARVCHLLARDCVLLYVS